MKNLIYSALIVLMLSGVVLAQECVVDFNELEPVAVSQGFGGFQVDAGVMGQPLSIAGQSFEQGLGTHAPSKIVYDLDGKYLRFEASVGVDDVMKDYTKSSVVFQVFVDGEKKFDSGVMKINEPAKEVSVTLEKAKTLELVVTTADDGDECDHADWGNARLISTESLLEETRTPVEPKALTVTSPSLSLDLSATGKIVAMRSGDLARPVRGQVELVKCVDEGKTTTHALDGGGVESVRTVRHESGDLARITERFLPTASGIRWEVEIRGLGEPWSTPIRRIFDYNAEPENDVLFWSAWSDPRCGRASAINKEDIVQRDPATVLYPLGTEHNWADPLLPQPLVRAKLYYGFPPYAIENPGSTIPFAGNLLCIPMLTFLEPKPDFGLTLMQDITEPLLDVTYDMTKSGKLTVSHINHRISKETPFVLSVDLVPHLADWRDGLRWARQTYAEYFEPPNPKAHQISGTAAYGRSIGVPKICENAEKYHKMAFRINWQASWDFPFFGMYIPPTQDDGEIWKAFGGWDYSVAQYREDARRMKEHGFYTLNYFNVFEIGSYTKWPPPPRTIRNDADLWRNNDDFIYTKLADGILMLPNDPDACKGKQGDYEGHPVGSWEGSLIFDCAVPSVRDFLLDQAKRHLDKIPDSSGICIDRLDWMRYYNLGGDDGISWFHDRPSRSFLVSWNDIMKELAPLMHDAGKVIYVNNHDKRIDTMKHIDGIYDEFTYAGAPLNLTALLCVAKPALGWTSGPHDLQPDPDAFFQKYLYLGVFPTAPIPENCHSINPDDLADRYYTDYGHLMDLMRGKTWVLEPHCIEACDGSAKVNLFMVPDGFVVPVCFAGDRDEVQLIIRNVAGLKKFRAEAFHAGNDRNSVPVASRVENGVVELSVPLKRGCAMVKLTND